MPLTTAEKIALQSSLAEVSAEVEALVVDPDVNPLQAQLDEALSKLAAAEAKIAKAIADLS